MDCEPREAERGAVGGRVSGILCSQVICTEHRDVETTIKPLCSPVVLVGHPSHGVGAWIPCPKWAKQHLLSPNSTWGSSIREGSNGEQGENPQ